MAGCVTNYCSKIYLKLKVHLLNFMWQMHDDVLYLFFRENNNITFSLCDKLALL